MYITENAMYNPEICALQFMRCDGVRSVVSCKFNPLHEPMIHKSRTICEHDLIYMLDGEWEIYCENTPYSLSPGHLLLLPGGHEHHGIHPSSPQINYVYMHLSPLEGDRLLYARSMPCAPDNMVVLPLLMDCRKNPSIRQHFEEIVFTCWQEGAYKKQRISSMVNMLLCELAELGSPCSWQRDELAFQIMHCIHATPMRFYSLDELAQLYGVSARTLSGRFKKASGYTVHQYQIHVKLEYAHSRLAADSSLSVRSVAREFGFYDEYQFSKLFKREFGYSPKELKQRSAFLSREYPFAASFIDIL